MFKILLLIFLMFFSNYSCGLYSKKYNLNMWSLPKWSKIVIKIDFKKIFSDPIIQKNKNINKYIKDINNKFGINLYKNLHYIYLGINPFVQNDKNKLNYMMFINMNYTEKQLFNFIKKQKIKDKSFKISKIKDFQLINNNKLEKNNVKVVLLKGEGLLITQSKFINEGLKLINDEQKSLKHNLKISKWINDNDKNKFFWLISEFDSEFKLFNKNTLKRLSMFNLFSWINLVQMLSINFNKKSDYELSVQIISDNKHAVQKINDKIVGLLQLAKLLAPRKKHKLLLSKIKVKIFNNYNEILIKLSENELEKILNK